MAVPDTTWTEQPLPPLGEVGYHLYEDGDFMLYEDGSRMLLDEAGVGLWVEQPAAVTTWTEQ